MTIKRMHAVVHGRVQGVFFRAFTEKEAIKLCIKGFVENCSEGTVEVVAEGAEEKLRELLTKLHKGPPSSDVEKVECKFEKATNEFSCFSVTY